MKDLFTKDKLNAFFSRKDLKDFFKKSKGLFYLLLGFLILLFLFYACNFSGGLSSEHDKWSQFGDFFNGVISPIFAAINICIFWYLTKVIDLNNDKRQEEMLKKEKELQKEMQDYEDKRQQEIQKNENQRQQQIEANENKRQQQIQENEDRRQREIEINENKRQQQIQENEDRRQRERLEHEKEILLMQFRKEEIDRFEDAIPNNMLIPENDNLINTFLKKLVLANAYIMTFTESKLGFFGLDKNSDIKNELADLTKAINKYITYIESYKDDNQRNRRDDIKELLHDIIFTKIKIITKLQNITLGVKNS